MHAVCLLLDIHIGFARQIFMSTRTARPLPMVATQLVHLYIVILYHSFIYMEEIGKKTYLSISHEAELVMFVSS